MTWDLKWSFMIFLELKISQLLFASFIYSLLLKSWIILNSLSFILFRSLYFLSHLNINFLLDRSVISCWQSSKLIYGTNHFYIIFTLWLLKNSKAVNSSYPSPFLIVSTNILENKICSVVFDLSFLYHLNINSSCDL